MGNFWDVVKQIVDAIYNFIDWYLNDTPLFNDTLDAIYEWGVETYRTLWPLIEEYIQYISEYIKG